MQPEEKTTRRPVGKIIFWFVLAWAVVMVVLATQRIPQDKLSISYSDFKKRVVAGEIREVTFRGDMIQGIFKNAVKVTPGAGDVPVAYPNLETTLPSVNDPELLGLLEKHGVTISAKSKETSWFTTALLYLLPWVLIIAFFVYGSKRLQGGAGGGAKGNVFGFGKSKAKLYQRSNTDVTFKDVAGMGNVKSEFTEIIDYLKDPSKYKALGAKLPKGVLLAGAPGTGKTLLARATAGEANVPFFSISGSEFVEIFVGVGASRVRDLFENAKKDSPSIIFIDELDSIGRVRGAGVGGGHEEREQTLNQILAEMDGFSAQESVIVMAATNRPDVLDPALIRPGRFDRQINTELPQKAARQQILAIHSREVPLGPDVNLEDVAKRSVGFSGAELKNLVNEAALLAARKGKHQVEAVDFEQGFDKILMGLEREDLINEEEKKAVAYHESGHALMAKLMPGTDPLKRVSIIPRGMSLGATEQLPEEDRHNYSRAYLLSRLAVIMGGRVAEKIIYNDITTGAGDDLKKASQLARRMVCQWGMSDQIGPVTFARGEIHPYIGREMADQRDYSEHTARMIDEEVHGVLTTMEKKCEEILQANRGKLDALANALLDSESLTNEEVDRVLAAA